MALNLQNIRNINDLCIAHTKKEAQLLEQMTELRISVGNIQHEPRGYCDLTKGTENKTEGKWRMKSKRRRRK
jgi:hypothetical protein